VIEESVSCTRVTLGAGTGTATSNASTATVAAVAAGFRWPVTSILNVWPDGVRSVALNTGACTCSIGAYRSSCVTKAPSRNTSAIPRDGPRTAIQLTDVPVKLNAALAPAAAERAAVPPPVLADVPLKFRFVFC
jgi:hypothetical protein